MIQILVPNIRARGQFVATLDEIASTPCHHSIQYLVAIFASQVICLNVLLRLRVNVVVLQVVLGKQVALPIGDAWLVLIELGVQYRPDFVLLHA